MANIARLAVALALNTADFVSGLAGASQRLGAFADKAAVVGKVGATAFVAMTTAAMAFADEIADVAKSNDVAIDSIIKLQNALANSGGSAESAGRLLSSFTKFVDDAAEGSFEAQKKLANMGVSLKDLGNLSTDDLFQKVIKGLAAIEDPLTRSARGMDAFGKAGKGVDWIGVADGMTNGAEASKKQAKAVEDAAAAFDMLKQAGRDLNLLISETLGPSLKITAEYIQNITKDSGLLGTAFKTVFQTIAVLGSDLQFIFQGITDEISHTIANIKILTTEGLKAAAAANEAYDKRRQQARADLDLYQSRIMGTDQYQGKGFDDPRIVKPETGSSGPKRIVTPGVDTKGKALAAEKNSKDFEIEKLKLQNEFFVTSNLEKSYYQENRQYQAELDKAYAEARLEMKQKNISEENKYEAKNLDILHGKLRLADAAYLQKTAAMKERYRQEELKKGFEISDLKLAAEFSATNKFLTETELIELEKKRKTAEVTAEYYRKNTEENYQFEAKNFQIMTEKKAAINLDYEEKRKALSIKRSVEQASQQLADKEERDAAFAAQSNSYQQGALAMFKKQDAEKTALDRAQEMFDLEQRGRYLKAEELQQEKEILQQRWKHKDALAQINAMENLDRTSREAAIEKENNLNQRALDGIRERGRLLAGQKSGSAVDGFLFRMSTFGKDMETSFDAGGKAFDSLMGGMTKALDEFVSTGKLNFEDFAKSVIKDMLAIQLRASATNLFSMLAKSVVGAFSGGSAMAPTPGISGKAFADGGDPPVGVASLVGERGPELFVPRSAGTIVPNHMLGNNQQAPTINYNGPYIASMSAIDTQSGLQFLAKNKQSVWAAYQSANRSVPMSR
jgi:lambda family phage tail tape measure protein